MADVEFATESHQSPLWIKAVELAPFGASIRPLAHSEPQKIIGTLARPSGSGIRSGANALEGSRLTDLWLLMQAASPTRGWLTREALQSNPLQ